MCVNQAVTVLHRLHKCINEEMKRNCGRNKITRIYENVKRMIEQKLKKII